MLSSSKRRRNLFIFVVLLVLTTILFDLSRFQFRLNEIDEFDTLIQTNCPVANLTVAYSCLKSLSQYKIKSNNNKNELDIIYYHSFWRIDEDKPHHLRVLMLQMLSFLATQDLSKAHFILWVQNNFNQEIRKALIKKFNYYFNKDSIQIRVLNFTDLCSTGIFKNQFNDCNLTTYSNAVAYSDFIRFLVLYKYGGLYTDGDIVFLRDMRPFWSKTFVHRWSANDDYNTAVMGLQLSDTKLVTTIYETILNDTKHRDINLVDAFYPTRIKDTIKKLNNGKIYNYLNFLVYHSALFDPAWLCNDGVLKRYNEKTVCKYQEFYDTIIAADEFDIKNFYDGAFTFHLHLGNCGKCQINATSFFNHIEIYFSKIVEHLNYIMVQ